MPCSSKIKQAYVCQRKDAKRRGIPFLLTYEQWCEVWLESGKWEYRGKRRGQYVMSRPGDQGAYELGNVVIVPIGDNMAERNARYSGERHANWGKPRFIVRDERGRFVWGAFRWP